MNTIPEGTQQQLLTSSLMEEAIASSQLEGAATSRMVAKEMLRSRREPRDKSERMILNNYLTMRYLVERKNEPMSVERLMAIHRMVVQGTLDDEEDEGNARTNNDVRVVDHVSGDVLYEPPSHERIQELLRAVCSFANDGPNDPFVHPVIRGIILHFLIGYVHPFVDGNGRTARALFYWYLLRKGYWLVEFLSISKVILRAPVQYARAYLHTEQDGNDLTYFVLFGLRSMDLARHDLDQYLQRKLHERRSLFKFVTAAPINDRQTELVALWVREPERSLSIRDVQARFDISYQTARADLLGLAALGLLRSRKSVGKRLAFFQAPEMDTILASMRASK
jgi:Fic family protein